MKQKIDWQLLPCFCCYSIVGQNLVHINNDTSASPIWMDQGWGLLSRFPPYPCFPNFYPRPVLAFGYCRCLRLCVCVCLSVCQSFACPRDNLGPIQARITKFGPKMQKTLVKVPIVLWTDRPWPSRSNLTWKSKFTPFWASSHHNSPPIHSGITKFGPEVQNTLVKIPSVLAGNWPWPSRSNMNLKKVKFSGFTLLKIHNHHITTREWWVPRVFHGPDCFMVSILCMCSYA